MYVIWSGPSLKSSIYDLMISVLCVAMHCVWQSSWICFPDLWEALQVFFDCFFGFSDIYKMSWGIYRRKNLVKNKKVKVVCDALKGSAEAEYELWLSWSTLCPLPPRHFVGKDLAMEPNNAQLANLAIFVQWVYWVYVFCQNTCPKWAHCAMHEQV